MGDMVHLLHANFQLATPFHSQPRVTYGTNRQTGREVTAIDALCATLRGGA